MERLASTGRRRMRLRPAWRNIVIIASSLLTVSAGACATAYGNDGANTSPGPDGGDVGPDGGVEVEGGPGNTPDACSAPTGCPPEVVAEHLREPRDIAVCAGRVYWAEWADGGADGAFRSCETGKSCSSDAFETLASDLAGAMLVSGGCTGLMFGESIGKHLFQMTRDDAGVLSRTLLADETDRTNNLGSSAFGTGLLVWASLPDTVRRCTPTNCQASRGNIAGGRTNLGPIQMTTDRSDQHQPDPKPLVVWAEESNGGQLFKCRPGCLSVSQASPPAQGTVVDLLVSSDGSTYYYLTSSGSLVSVTASTPQTATPIAVGLDPPAHFAFDEASGEFYVTSATAGTIVRVALGSNERHVVFPGLHGPWAIAFDDNTIYWTDRVDGTVYRARVR
jgi:hypothetical protein